MSDLPIASGYQPEPEIRSKLFAFIEALAETGDVKASAESVKLNRVTLYKIRRKYPPLDEAWTAVELQRKTILKDEIRQALIDQALIKRNTHAIIHADRLYNKEDYLTERARSGPVAVGGVTINIVVPAPPKPDEIPEGDGSAYIEAQATLLDARVWDEDDDDPFADWGIEEAE